MEGHFTRNGQNQRVAGLTRFWWRNVDLSSASVDRCKQIPYDNRQFTACVHSNSNGYSYRHLLFVSMASLILRLWTPGQKD